MNPDLAMVAAWSYGIAGIGYVAFAAYLGFAWRGDLRGLALILASGLTGLWGFLALAFVWAPSAPLLGLGAVADVLRVGGWYAFLLLVIERAPAEVPSADTVSAGPTSSVPASIGPTSAGSPGAGAEPASRTIARVAPAGQARLMWLVPVAGALVTLGLLAQIAVALRVTAFGDPGRFAAFDGLAASIFGLVLVEQLFRNVSEDARWNVKPLCLGLAAAFIFDLYLHAEALLFNRLDADAWSVRGFVHALVIPLLATTVVRNRDWTFQIALSRRVVFHSTALFAAGLYMLFIAGAGYYVRYFGGSWGGALQVALLFAGLLMLGALAFSGSMRAKLRVLVSKHFFSYRYDYRDEWLRFTQALSTKEGELRLGQQVIKGLADLVESPAGGLWLIEAGGRSFAQAARWNLPASAAIEEIDSAFSRFLRESGWVVNLEEFRASPERYRELVLPAWISALPNAWLIVPLAIGGELIGFVVLATARTRVDVNWEVNDLLKTAARQAASFLAQTQAAEALLESRKFDAFNRMSAFVVHDLKNIVAQLSLMLKNAERHRANPEFQQDMLMTVGHSVERMKQLMLQLRDGTTPVESARGIDLAGVLDRILRAKAGQKPTPEVQCEEKVLAMGHEDRLERVIGHVVQNAMDATPDDGRVWIRLGKQDGSALVEVGDTGHGMTPEFVRERLFKPFQTTKQGGMGIGAYESFQYVRELGGQVQVESAPGEGTRVRLLLPLFGPQGESANDAQRRMGGANPEKQRSATEATR